MATDYVIDFVANDQLTPAIGNIRREIDRTSSTAGNLSRISESFKRIDQSAAPVKKKLTTVKAQMQRLALDGQANSDMFKEMAAACKRYQKALDDVEAATRGASSATEELTGKGSLLKQVFSSGGVKLIGDKLGGAMGIGKLGSGVVGALGAMVSPVGMATAGVAALGVTLVEAAKAANEFETHLDALQALTGMTDEGMKSISDGAIEMSKKFGASAGDIVDAMALIGSQAPELLKDSAALMNVTDAANTLAKAAGIDVVSAAKAITGTMNQMGASASQATDIINTFAAASQQGSADVSFLNAVFEKSGAQARLSGMDYVQLAAATETVAGLFGSAEVAGTNLNSLLLKLSVSGKDEFTPSVVGMSQALENLAAAEMTDAEKKKLVGESNIKMLNALIEGRDTFNAYCDSLEGTNTAQEQMATNMDNWAGRVDKIKAMWEAFLITLGQSAVMQGVMDEISVLMGLLGDIVDACSEIIKSFESLGCESVPSVDMLRITCKALGAIIKWVGEAVSALVHLYAKGIDAMRKGWQNLTDKVRDTAAFKAIERAFTSVVDAAVQMIGKIKKLWNDFKKWLGMNVAEATVETTTTGGTADNGGALPDSAGVSSAGTSSATAKAQTAQAGSIAALRAQITAYNAELENTANLSAERIRQIKAETAALEAQIDTLKRQQVAAQGEKLDPLEVPTTIKIQTPDVGKAMDAVGAELKASMDETMEALRALHEESKGVLDGMTGNIGSTIQSFTELGTVLSDKLTSGTEKAAAAMATVGQSLEAIGAEGAIAKAGATLAAIGQIILGFATASASAATMGPWGWLAFVGAGLGAVATMVSTIQGYADGGIISGATAHGDRILARVNAGEMVLNRRQQSNLFDLLDGGRVGERLSDWTITLKGADLEASRRNYNKIMGRIQ